MSYVAINKTVKNLTTCES